MCYICKAEKVDYTHFYGQVKIMLSIDKILGIKGIVHNFFIFGQDLYFG